MRGKSNGTWCRLREVKRQSGCQPLAKRRQTQSLKYGVRNRSEIRRPMHGVRGAHYESDGTAFLWKRNASLPILGLLFMGKAPINARSSPPCGLKPSADFRRNARGASESSVDLCDADSNANSVRNRVGVVKCTAHERGSFYAQLEKDFQAEL